MKSPELSTEAILSFNLEDQIKMGKRVKCFLTDVDGVLTDSGVYYDNQGEALKRFSIYDGLGLSLVRDLGVPRGFITT